MKGHGQRQYFWFMNKRLCFESSTITKKVKETVFEVPGRSGGVARFSIAAFASKCSGAASRILDRGGFQGDKPQSR